MERRELEILDEIHAALPRLEAPGDLTDRIMSLIERADSERAGLAWKVLAPAAAAVFILLGIRIGTQIADVYFRPEPVIRSAEVTGLEYLDAYPPDSFGQAIELAVRGGENE